MELAHWAQSLQTPPHYRQLQRKLQHRFPRRCPTSTGITRMVSRGGFSSELKLEVKRTATIRIKNLCGVYGANNDTGWSMPLMPGMFGANTSWCRTNGHF